MPNARRMRAVALGGVLCFVGAVGWSSAGAGTGVRLGEAAPAAPVLAAMYTKPGRVVELTARTLRAVPRHSVAVGFPPARAAARAPTGARLAVASGGDAPAIAIADLASWRLLGSVSIPSVPYAAVTAVSWPSAERILVLVEHETSRVVTVNPLVLQIVAERELDGSVVRSAATRAGLVLLTAPRGRVGPARLVLAGADGRLRSTGLPGISAGWNTSGALRQLVPGLAVDRAGRRAIVVTAGGRAADVDLATLHVSLHRLSRRERLLGSREPAARAKGPPGSAREALWLDSQHVAVSGNDVYGTGRETRHESAGVAVIDTRRWTIRVLQRQASGMARVGSALLVYGWSFAQPPRTTGVGLRIYSFAGRERHHLFGGRVVDPLEVGTRYAYIDEDGSAMRFRIVDVATGRVVGSARTPGTTILLDVR